MISGTGIVTLLVGRDETRVDSCCWKKLKGEVGKAEHGSEKGWIENEKGVGTNTGEHTKRSMSLDIGIMAMVEKCHLKNADHVYDYV